MAISAMCLIGIGVASVFPTILGYIGHLYAGLSGTAFSIAFFIALIGNTLLNYSVGLVSASVSLEKFPLVLLLCFIVLCVLILFGLTNLKKHIKI
jgi:MFS family permease